MFFALMYLHVSYTTVMYREYTCTVYTVLNVYTCMYIHLDFRSCIYIYRTIKWRSEAGRQSTRRLLWQTGSLLQ